MSKGLVNVLLLGALVAGNCFAHARLQSSTPANNAALTEAPKKLTLTFSEPARLIALKLSGAQTHSDLPVDKGAKPAQTITVELPPLAPGSYTVEWSALAGDGHPSKGSLTFVFKG
jgi:methionine-rich copper-binding protein CopC